MARLTKATKAQWPLFGFALLPLIAAAAASAAPALPTGGKVVAGSAVIGAPTGGALTIDQSSKAAIIDWSGFSIGSGNSVTFDNGSGATLNRVTGTGVSSLNGVLNATGSVFVINADGVVVGKGGIVRTGGSFVASTLDLTNANFLAGGDLIFTGKSTATVANLGKVGSLGGNVALIAATVSNSGSLTAAKGTAGLVSGYKVTLRDADHDGQGLFTVQIGGKGTSVTNCGLIAAANAELRAEGGNVYALAGNTAGVIRATGVKATDGHVWLIADSGTLDVAGSITAKGMNGAAGTIETSGQTVNLGAAAIDAHGGTWLLDPYDLTIDATAAMTIDSSLAADTSVTLATTATGASGPGVKNASGNGDIVIAAPISWATGATFSLSAYRNIDINADITVAGGGALKLVTGTGVAGDYVIAGGDSVSFTGGSGAGASLTINGAPYTLLYDMAQVQAINASATTLAGNYAMAISMNAATDPTTPAAWLPIGSDLAQEGYLANAVAFSGQFAGLNHTISNLTVNMVFNQGSSGTSFVGMFGVMVGAIRDFGLVGGSVTSGQNNCFQLCDTLVGDLVGEMGGNGTLTHVFATGSVSGVGSGRDYTGGLVGLMANPGGTGNIVSDSYATGAITGNGFTGGLVGAEYGLLITNSYATGAVSGGSWVGGLLGYNSLPAKISNSYSTGSVTGSGSVGGLVGYSEAGGGVNTTDSYWDTQTSGVSGSAGGTGMTTAQLKSGLPTGFSPLIWGINPGVSYPYLLSFGGAASTGQTLSGVVHSALNGGAVAGMTVVAVLNGTTVIGTAVSGANGVYSISVPAGTLTAGSTVVVYVSSGGIKADSVADDIVGGTALTGLNLYGGAVTVHSGDASLTALSAGMSAGLGSATTAAGSDILFGASGGTLSVSGGASLNMVLNATDFDFNQSLNLGAGTLKLMSAGGVSQTQGSIIAAALEGLGQESLALTDAGNRIAAVSGWRNLAGSFDLTDASGLTVNGNLIAAAGVNLTTTGGSLDLLRAVSSGTGGVTLNASGQIVEVGALARITDKGALTLDSTGGDTLQASNSVSSLSIDNAGGGAVAYREAGVLQVGGVSDIGGTVSLGAAGGMRLTGVVDAGTVTLKSGTGISELASAGIVASTFDGSASGKVLLDGTNRFAILAGFTDTGGGFSLVDHTALTQKGTFDGAGQTVRLTATSGNLDIDGILEATTLDLAARAGSLGESVTLGAIKVATLNATADTGITLTSAKNAIAAIGTNHTNSGPDQITQ